VKNLTWSPSRKVERAWELAVRHLGKYPEVIWMSFWRSLFGLSFHERCQEHLDIFKAKIVVFNTHRLSRFDFQPFEGVQFHPPQKERGRTKSLEIELISYLSSKVYNI